MCERSPSLNNEQVGEHQHNAQPGGRDAGRVNPGRRGRLLVKKKRESGEESDQLRNPDDQQGTHQDTADVHCGLSTIAFSQPPDQFAGWLDVPELICQRCTRPFSWNRRAKSNILVKMRVVQEQLLPAFIRSPPVEDTVDVDRPVRQCNQHLVV